MKITKALSVFVFLMICSLSIFGQVQSYKGQVKDPTGKALEGITVTSTETKNKTLSGQTCYNLMRRKVGQLSKGVLCWSIYIISLW